MAVNKKKNRNLVFISALCFFFSSLEGHASENGNKLLETFSPAYQLAISNIIRAFRHRNIDAPVTCEGRLTLTSGTPVTDADVTAASTIYFSPYEGYQLSLYSGSRWQILTFSETSVAVPSTTTTPFDIFAYSTGSTLALTTLNWSNATTRATALTLQNGVSVKSGSLTNRYLGTGYTTGTSGQIEDSIKKRYLWNQCNRLPRKVLAQSNADTWAYTTATWRAASGSSSNGVNEVEFVLGNLYEPITLSVWLPEVGNTSGGTCAVGIGIDSTSANSADLFGVSLSAAGSRYGAAMAHYRGFPSSVGYHYAQWLEISSAAGTTNWYTYSTSAATARQGGVTGEIWQ